MQELKVWFDHGLGDCVHFAHLLQLFKRRGYTVSVHYEQNKTAVWQAAGIEYTHSAPYHKWAYHSGFNSPNAIADGAGSKIYLNFDKEPMPHIGHPDELWEELC